METTAAAGAPPKQTIAGYSGEATTKQLGRGVIQPFHLDSPPLQVDLLEESQVVTYQGVLPAGCATGWHYHPALLLVTVTSGTYTEYIATPSGCVSLPRQVGESYLEEPGQIVNGVNTSDQPVTWLSTIIGQSPDQPTHINVPAPAGCPE